MTIIFLMNMGEENPPLPPPRNSKGAIFSGTNLLYLLFQVYSLIKI